MSNRSIGWTAVFVLGFLWWASLMTAIAFLGWIR